MKVETYEIEELNSSEATTMAADSEAIELCEKLGLKGQLRQSNTETVTRVQYRLITNEERAIYGTIFPNKTKVEDYRDGIIPLRVLQLLAHCKELNYFDEGFVVWHPAANQKDPVLVGLRKERPTGWTFDRTDTYLLARWGEALQTLDELREKARGMLVAKWRAKLEQIKAEVPAHIACLESTAETMLRGGDSKDLPYYSW